MKCAVQDSQRVLSSSWGHRTSARQSPLRPQGSCRACQPPREGASPAEPATPSGGRVSCRAAGGNQRLFLRCLGGFISPRKHTEYTENDVVTGRRRACRAVFVSQRVLSMSGHPLGIARLPPSRSPPREGASPAEPDVSAQCSVFSIAKSPLREGEATAEPQDSIARRALRLSGSFAHPRLQSTPLAIQFKPAHRISRSAVFFGLQ